MRLISAIMNFYWSHAIVLQKLSNDRSYKFNLILTVKEVKLGDIFYWLKTNKKKQKKSSTCV